MERERGDEIPYGEPMRMPENMDSADLGGYIATDDDFRAWCEKARVVINPDDLGDFLESYVDPDWISRGRDAEDTWRFYLRHNPQDLADALALYLKENQ